MNSYSELLRRAFVEVGLYANTEKGAEWSKRWYSDLKRLLVLGADEQENTKAEKLLDVIAYKVSRSGPLEPRFAPSLSAARVAMQARLKNP